MTLYVLFYTPKVVKVEGVTILSIIVFSYWAYPSIVIASEDSILL